MSTFTQTETYVVISCGECGVRFAIETGHKQRLLETHDTWYCPNGHQRYYSGKSDAEKAKDAAEAAAKRERERRLNAEADRDRMKFALRSQKAAKTRMARRVAAGVCPCCNRTFTNLARHMSGQHPGFGEKK